MRGAQFISLAILLVAVTLACAMPGTYQPTAPTVQIIPTDNYVQPTLTPPPVTLSDNYRELPSITNIVIVTETVSKMTIPIDFWQYTVKQGDSLYKLAYRFCSDPRKYVWLAQINGLELGDILTVGQTLQINCGKEQ